MKTIGKLFTLGAIFMLVGCYKPPMEKSVMEKMEMDELEAVIVKQDSLFPKFYEDVQMRVSLMKDTDKVKFKELTYWRTYRQYRKMKAFDKVDEPVKQLVSKWMKEYRKITEEAPLEKLLEIPTVEDYMLAKRDSILSGWDSLAHEFYDRGK